MMTRRKCYNSKDKKINCLDGISDLSVFALIMLVGQLNIFWSTVTIAHSFIHLQKFSQMEASAQSLLALYDYFSTINIHTFPSFLNICPLSIYFPFSEF